MAVATAEMFKTVGHEQSKKINHDGDTTSKPSTSTKQKRISSKHQAVAPSMDSSQTKQSNIYSVGFLELLNPRSLLLPTPHPSPKPSARQPP